MIPEIGTIALALAVGAPVALALDRTSRGGRLLAEAFLFGCGLVAVSLMSLSPAGIEWSVTTLLVTAILFAACAVAVALRAVRKDRNERLHEAEAPNRWHVVDALTLLLVAGYALYATASRVVEWDFFAIWGLKALAFHEAGGIDWRFLSEARNAYAHPDYPPLVPLVYDAASLLRGGWSDRWIGLLTAAWGAAAIVLVRSHVRLATGDHRIAALAALAVSGFALGPWIGIADAPLMAFAFGGCMLVRRWLQTGDAGSIRAGTLLLGLGALTKNEGVALIVSVAVALALVPKSGRIRRVIALWPAALLAALWQAPRLAAGLESDIVDGAAGRLTTSRILEALEAIWRHPSNHVLFAIAVSIAIIAGLRTLAREERFLSLVVLAQFGFVLLSYFASPWASVARHVETSWDRVAGQTMPLVIVLAVAVLAPRLRANDAGPSPAEVRSPEHCGGTS